MRVLLAGATGFIGSTVMRKLAEEGCELVVLARSRETAVAKLGGRFAIFEWKSASEPFPEKALEGVEAVVNLAGEPLRVARWSNAFRQRLQDSRIAFTRGLVGAIAHVRDLGGEDRPSVLVSASAVGVYGDREDEVLTEDSSLGNDYLAELCRNWEGETDQDPGLRVVKLRLGVVLGRGGGVLGQLLPLVRKGRARRFGNGRQWVSWIHEDDVAALIAHALRSPGLEGPVNAVASVPVRNEEFTRVLAEAAGRDEGFAVPALALRLWLGDAAGLLLSSQRALPVRARASGFTFGCDKFETALQMALR
jgi:uncharacterized protein